jgi:hypothetical protein
LDDIDLPKGIDNIDDYADENEVATCFSVDVVSKVCHGGKDV